MASTYSPNLRLELIGTGEQQGTWGTTTNTNLGTLLEEAIGGYVSVTVSDVGDTTLTTSNGSADQSRNAVINLTGTITADRNVICPAIEKLYVVNNATTGGFSITFKVSSQTGVTIPNGQTWFLYVDGTDARKISGGNALTASTNTFTANQIISVTDNTNAALRVTQLGTGNALLVEDSANPDATPTVISADGTVVVGHTAALATDNYGGTQITPKVQIQGVDGPTSALSATAWAATSGGPQIALGKSRSATVGTNTVVQSGDVLGAVTFAGDDGTAIIVGASILGESDGTPGTNDMPGRLVFSTTADGAQTVTERLRIASTGAFGLSGANYGSANQVLTSNGSTSAPTWQGKIAVSSTTSTTSPWAWNSDGYDQFAFTALANDLTINADSGTPANGQRVTFRFKPNTTGIDLTWTTGSAKSFRAIGVTFPTALTNAKTTYVGCIYNSADQRWDVVAVATED